MLPSHGGRRTRTVNTAEPVRPNIRQGFDELRCFFLMIAARATRRAAKSPDNRQRDPPSETARRCLAVVSAQVHAGLAEAYFAAVGSGAGLSDKRVQIGDHVGTLAVLREAGEAHRGARDKALGVGEELVEVVDRSRSPPLPFMAAEKLKPPRPVPFGSADDAIEIRDRRGSGRPSRRCGRPRTSWRRRRPSRPRRSASSFSIGSDGAPRLPWPRRPAASSFTAISKPGFSGISGAKIAWAAKLVTSRDRQRAEDGAENLVEFEGVHNGSGSRPERSTEGRQTAADAHQESAFAPHPQQG